MAGMVWNAPLRLLWSSISSTAPVHLCELTTRQPALMFISIHRPVKLPFKFDLFSSRTPQCRSSIPHLPFCMQGGHCSQTQCRAAVEFRGGSTAVKSIPNRVRSDSARIREVSESGWHFKIRRPFSFRWNHRKLKGPDTTH